MTRDASFADGAEQALRLRAETVEDLGILSALVQDAVSQTSEIAWLPKRHRFTLLINRFRWEDAPQAQRQGRPFERVQALLSIESVLRARVSGLDPADRDLVVSLLALDFTETDAGAGQLRLLLAGDGEIALDVECLDVTLADVTRPYRAQAQSAPRHRED